MEIIIVILALAVGFWLGTLKEARYWSQTICDLSTVPKDASGEPRYGHHLCKIETNFSESRFGRRKIHSLTIGLRQDDMIDDQADMFTIVLRPDWEGLKYRLSWRGLIDD